MSATPRSLRRDLSLGLVAGIAVLWFVAIAAAAVLVRAQLDEVFDSALQEVAERILPIAVTEIINAPEDVASEARLIAPIGPHDEFLTYVVRDASGEILLYSHDVAREVFAEQPEAGFHDRADHRIYGLSAVSGSYMIEVAEPLAHRRKATMQVFLTLGVPLLILLPLSLGWIGWFTRRSLRPVALFSRRLRQRDVHDLSPVETDGLQSEFTPLGLSVNRLMERLSRALENERNFTSNAAHELRTPIAAALAQTQRLLREIDAGPAQDRARAVEAELKRLGHLSDRLLQLARAEGAGVLREKAGDLVPILDMVVQDFRREGTGERLEVSHPARLLSHMDPDAFAILARNLMENALVHGAAGAPVAVTLTADRLFRVANAGPVVPEERLAQLTRRFERGGAGASGTGLGLAIAEGIAAAAQSQLELRSPRPGAVDGFSAEIALP